MSLNLASASLSLGCRSGWNLRASFLNASLISLSVAERVTPSVSYGSFMHLIPSQPRLSHIDHSAPRGGAASITAIAKIIHALRTACRDTLPNEFRRSSCRWCAVAPGAAVHDRPVSIAIAATLVSLRGGG